MNSKKDTSKIDKARRKPLFWKLFFSTILFVLVILPITFILLTFEKTPLVSESKTVEVEDATRVRALAKQTHKILFQPYSDEFLAVSEDDFNAVLGFMARGVSRFAGKANVTQDQLEIKGTFRLPRNPLGNYINLSASLRPSRSGLDIKQVSIGRVNLSGKATLPMLRFSLDMVLGKKQGTMLISSVKAVIFREKNVTFVLRDLTRINPERLKYLKGHVKGLRDYVDPLGDPLVVRIYYNKLVEISEIYRQTKSVSLAQFTQPLFALASERSKVNGPAVENHAAIMALSMFAGSYYFEGLIGSVRTDQEKLYKPYTENIVLEGRRDLRLHFIISAGLKLVADSSVSYAIGEFKELLDAGRGGSGFSFADLAADRAGVRFAEIATDPGEDARKIQSVLAMFPSELYFFPKVTDFPEGISQVDFEGFYGGVDNANYMLIVDKIDKRINQVYSYLEDKGLEK